jgi:hypothetical protein
MRLLPIHVHTQDALKTCKGFPWKKWPKFARFGTKKKNPPSQKP